ncbi:GNAT family N-acetyltransferase [Halalkalibacillus sediminis]|uniref:GNAT family N-acetyltransferase n=1 Tax=Halalkalibacillus sediminis TaxID=2018042 RepID=A0A2I0QRU5_9BACI|nr:GNAT family N-acetyltransferase [Halalkalibacillus sediminis]PKR77052.1 GNAT family N-acetyltransferase [Halalkalibacillus sediminis]
MDRKWAVDCTMRELVDIWNISFEGYAVDVKMTPATMIERVANENLDLTRSVVCFERGKPAGIVMNSFREIDGKNYAWNGGTGIPVAFRGKGVSRYLMGSVDQVYKDNNVDIAVLEAISSNEKAINLYEKNGYVIDNRLKFLKAEKIVKSKLTSPTKYQIEDIPKEKIQSLSFYREEVPWQNQLKSLKGAECKWLVEDGSPVAYAVYRSSYDQLGSLERVVLHQCSIDSKSVEGEEKIRLLLADVFQVEKGDFPRVISNFPVDDGWFIEIFQKMGFEELIEQVYMKKIY